MTTSLTPEKPREVFYAELALWAWTAWMFWYGLYETRRQIPEIEDALSGLQDTISITPDTLLKITVAGYALLALLSAWVVFKIGKGKHWARSSLLWGFILEALTMLAPPYHAPLAYIGDAPDMGLQIYALYLLYGSSSRAWFDRNVKK